MGTAQLLSEEQRNNYLHNFPGWTFSPTEKKISRHFKFKNYDDTLTFINAAAEIANKENHHPNIEFGYNNCAIHYSTHSADGVTLYDFICAAHIEQL